MTIVSSRSNKLSIESMQEVIILPKSPIKETHVNVLISLIELLNHAS